MSEFTVKIEDEIVQALGKQAIENYLQMFITQAILKAAVNDVLQDYEKSEITNDPNWEIAQTNAFANDRYSQFIKVYANI